MKPISKFQAIRLVIYLFTTFILIDFITPYSSSLTEKDFISYKNEYMYIIDKYCTPDKYFYPNHHIILDSLSGDTVGLCIRTPNKFTIIIEPEYWYKTNIDNRRSLIFHELTHCLFGEPHIDDQNHYMYDYTNLILESVLMYQTETLIKERCK